MSEPKTIIIMTGSVRPNSVSKVLLPVVKELVETEGAKAEIANLEDLNLPFFDGESSPASDDFVISHQSVQDWSDMVSRIDGVIMLTPEYNNQLSGVQKNAIDWLCKEWQDKPISAVCYGWGGGELSGDLLKKLIVKVGGKVSEPFSHLYFTKDISTDGLLIDETSARDKITLSIKNLL